MALNKVLLSFSDAVKDTRVDAVVDNKALSFSWQKPSRSSRKILHSGDIKYTRTNIGSLISGDIPLNRVN